LILRQGWAQNTYHSFHEINELKKQILQKKTDVNVQRTSRGIRAYTKMVENLQYNQNKAEKTGSGFSLFNSYKDTNKKKYKSMPFISQPNLLYKILWPFPSSSQERARSGVLYHLHSMGYFLLDGANFGGDYVLYPGDPRLYHAQYIIKIIAANSPLKTCILTSHVRVSQNERKQLILAITREKLLTKNGGETILKSRACESCQEAHSNGITYLHMETSVQSICVNDYVIAINYIKFQHNTTSSMAK
jgi:tRNA-intron lyase